MDRLIALLVVLAGAAAALVLVAVAPALARNGANFGNTCDIDRITKQDLIYEPTQLMGHDHLTLGAFNMVNADNANTLRQRTEEETTCNRKENKSSYWFMRINRNVGQGPERLPVYKGNNLGAMTMYYRAGGIEDHSEIVPFPRNFEMVARDDGGAGDVKWGCTPETLGQELPETCESKMLSVRWEFGQCWDGVNVPDSAKEPESVVGARAGTCPEDYPIALPQITQRVEFVLPSEEVGEITVAGMAPETMEGVNDRPPSTAHADFANGWPMAELEKNVEACIVNVEDTATTEEKPDFCRDPENQAL